ncbi:glutamate racemase [Halioxenophilus sp. WMMB6]|uniref:glutamate racemase n=1 Tax=Halioxenophilus sp. WMMB6 TaxID=3073815 RepID=UPI00295F01DF|nr:glutamate racemase [Halioxenophilus sp. WMMB6]
MNTQRQPRPINNGNPTVLVFDSGVGGLSIVQELIKRLPQLNVTFAADNAAFPYGTKSESELIERVDMVLHGLQSTLKPDLIVVACNTASTITLPVLRERFSIPVVGVVPAIKPAALISHSKTIGLLATPGTVSRDYTTQLIADFAPHCTVVKVGSSKLVEYAERKLISGDALMAEVADEVSIFTSDAVASELDTIVLACTHFPLLKEELSAALPNIRHWVDSGSAIARRVESLLFDSNEVLKTKIPNNYNPPIYQSVFTAPINNHTFLMEWLASWFGDHWSIFVD